MQRQVHTRFPLGAFLVVLAAVIGSFPGDAAAQADLNFTKIIDSTSSVYFNFGEGPAINSSGVVFFADRINSVEGYYLGNGGAITTLVQNNTSTVSSFFPRPYLHENGALAFPGFPDGGGQAIYRLNNSVLTTIADSAGPLQSFFQAHVAADGNVAFFASRDSGQEGIYKGSGAVLTPIAETTSGLFDDLGFLPSINDSGEVAFLGELGTARGIYLGNGGTPTPIAHSSGPFGSFFGRAPVINNSGQVAFNATLDSGVHGVFRYEDGTITTIADTAGGFQNIFNEFGFNDSGQIVFRALLDDGRRGLFFGPDPELHKIIATGDPLFGSTLLELEFDRGLSADGEVAFHYNLTNGLSGIAKVSAIPEPASFGLITGSLALLLPRRRRAPTR